VRQGSKTQEIATIVATLPAGSRAEPRVSKHFMQSTCWNLVCGCIFCGRRISRERLAEPPDLRAAAVYNQPSWATPNLSGAQHDYTAWWSLRQEMKTQHRFQHHLFSTTVYIPVKFLLLLCEYCARWDSHMPLVALSSWYRYEAHVRKDVCKRGEL